jgi:hypothetical protein
MGWTPSVCEVLFPVAGISVFEVTMLSVIADYPEIARSISTVLEVWQPYPNFRPPRKDSSMMISSVFRTTVLCALLGAWTAALADAAEFYQVRGGIPNSQYYFQANTVGNQYLFFIGNSVLAGSGLKDANLRYSAQMVRGSKSTFRTRRSSRRGIFSRAAVGSVCSVAAGVRRCSAR